MKNNIYELIIQSDDNVIATYNGQSVKAAIDSRDIELLNVIGNSNFKDKNNVDVIGERLYETIFKDQIDYHFTDKVLSCLDNHDEIIQIKIIFQEGINASYYNLPWEYLKNKKKQLVIGTHPKLSLTFDHYINKKTRKEVQLETPIRVMLVCFDIPEERAIATLPVFNVLNDQSLNKNITITSLQNPSIAEIIKLNNSLKPHIFHFLGHGKYIKTGNDSFYCLIDHMGKGYWENSDTFSDCFNIWKPYLLFIQSCESARSSTSINFFGGAAQYVRNDIPSVLLFRYPLLQETGWVFSKEFYRELFENGRIDVAAQKGREAIKNTQNDNMRYDFGIPTLWQRDQIVFRRLETNRQNITQVLHNISSVEELVPNIFEDLLKDDYHDINYYYASTISLWLEKKYSIHKLFCSLRLSVKSSSVGVNDSVFQDRYYALEEVIKDLNKHNCFVLLGVPGVGKSTLLRRFQLDSAFSAINGVNNKLVLYFELNQYSNEDINSLLSPIKWIKSNWNSRYAYLGDFDDYYNKGDFIFLLDGLNEIACNSKDNFFEKVNLWKNFARNIAKSSFGNKCIFSCRVNDYTIPLSSKEVPIPQILVHTLAKEQIHDIVDKYGREWPDSYFSSIDDRESIPLFNTPYFLKLLIMQSHYSKSIPENKAELFAGFIRLLLSDELMNSNPKLYNDMILSKKDRRRILQNEWPSKCYLPETGLVGEVSHLAFQMQSSQNESKTSQIRVKCDRALKMLKSKNLYVDIISVCIDLNIIHVDESNDEIFFSHQLLQEYFASLVAGQTESFEFALSEYHKEKVKPLLNIAIQQSSPHECVPMLPATGWEETMKFAFMISENENEFVTKLSKYNILLAADCALLKKDKIKECVLENFRKKILEMSTDLKVDLRHRISAGLVLGELGDPRLSLNEGELGNYLLPPFVKIPDGEYRIGDNHSSYEYNTKSRVVNIKGLCVSKYPVTNSEYLFFIESGGYEDEEWWHNNKIMEWLNGGDATEEIINDWIMKRKKILDAPELVIDLYKKGHITLIQAACFARVAEIEEGEFIQLVKDWYVMSQIKRPHFWDNNFFNNPNLPVVGVSWFEAVAYCNWLREQTNLPIRLLTEDEWEATAQGKEGCNYSFGNECNVCDCNTEELMLKTVTPIGVFCETNPINGCADLNGNIFEWVNSRYAPSEEEINFTTQMICKGGSWCHEKLRANSSYRGRGKTMTRNADLGFRICYNED